MDTVTYNIVTKPHLPAGERVPWGFLAGYLDIAALFSVSSTRFSLRTNENIWLLLPLVAVVVRFPYATQGDNRYRETSEEEDNISQANPESPAYDGSAVFIPFRGNPAFEVEVLEGLVDNSCLRRASVVQATKSLFSLIFLALGFAFVPARRRDLSRFILTRPFPSS